VAYATTQAGDWDADAVWGGAGPGGTPDADCTVSHTVTGNISVNMAAHTLTIDDCQLNVGDEETLQTGSGGHISIENGTVNCPGQLTLASGSTLTIDGGSWLRIYDTGGSPGFTDGGAIVLNGHLNMDLASWSPAGSYDWQGEIDFSGTSLDLSNMEISDSGVSTCLVFDRTAAGDVTFDLGTDDALGVRIAIANNGSTSCKPVTHKPDVNGFVMTNGVYSDNGLDHTIRGGSLTYNAGTFTSSATWYVRGGTVTWDEFTRRLNHVHFGHGGQQTALGATCKCRQATIGTGGLTGAHELWVYLEADDAWQQGPSAGTVDIEAIRLRIKSGSDRQVGAVDFASLASAMYVDNYDHDRTIAMTDDWVGGSVGLHVRNGDDGHYSGLDVGGHELSCGTLTLGINGGGDGRLSLSGGRVSCSSLACGGDSDDNRLALDGGLLVLDGTLDGTELTVTADAPSAIGTHNGATVENLEPAAAVVCHGGVRIGSGNNGLVVHSGGATHTGTGTGR